MATKQWKALVEARKATGAPVDFNSVVEEVTHLADGAMRMFYEQGITELPEPSATTVTRTEQISFRTTSAPHAAVFR
jgi:hypothetical protein